MLSFQVFLFKKALEEELDIIKWHPTNEQLEEMFNEIKNSVAMKASLKLKISFIEFTKNRLQE
ncbi:hypothetical protein ACH32W_19085 [Escherichia coli]|uniref:hypothetical protein n=1 Tax=Escherichia coli TaxID=562 RepID=UPI00379605D6